MSTATARNELVLSGVNNEYRRGCVAIFKAGGLRGGSPQLEAAFRSPDIGEGGQSAYILFPKSDVHAGHSARPAIRSIVSGSTKAAA